MKTITKTINLYTFDELKEESKAEATRLIAEGNMDTFGEELKEDFFNDCPKWAINPEPSFSFCSCQCDGFNFKCDRIDVSFFIPAETKASVKLAILERLDSVWSNGNGGRYTFPSLKDIEFELNGYKLYPFLDKLCREIVDKIRAEYLKTCKEWEKIGWNEINSKEDKEYCRKIAVENDCYFTESGELQY